MKKKRVVVILTIALLGVSLICALFFVFNNEKTIWNNKENGEIYRLSNIYGYKGNIFQFIDYLNGKELEVKNKRIFIDGIDSKVNSDIIDGKKTTIVRVGIEKNELNLICTNRKKYKLCTLGKKQKKSIEKVLKNNKQNEAPTNNYKSSAKVIVDRVETDKKKNIKVVARIKNNPGILGAKFNVDYDDKKLDLIRVDNGQAFKNVLTLTKPKVFDAGCSLLWDGTSIKDKDIKDGSIAVLYFNVKKEGECNVTLSYKDGDIVDNNLDNVFVSIISGKIVTK